MSTATARTRAVRSGTAADHLTTARRYATQPLDWPVAVHFDPSRRWYHRLAAGPDTEVWLLSWLPGQGTDLHDHGGSAGAFLVLSGTLTEHTPTAGRDGRPPRLRHARFGVDQGRSFGPRHIHQITNMGTVPAVSLHVYGPALREMTRYRIVDGRLVVTAVDRAGADW